MDDILDYFMKDIYREFHVRELARLAKKSPTTIAKQLETLKKKDFLTSSRRLGHLFYKANTENPAFRDLKIYHNIAAIRSSGLIDFLNEELGHPEAIVLFGSFSRGEDIARSDIDLAVIGFQEEELDLKDYEKKLGHEIQILILPKQKIAELKKKNKELLNNINNGIILSGFLDLF